MGRRLYGLFKLTASVVSASIVFLVGVDDLVSGLLVDKGSLAGLGVHLPGSEDGLDGLGLSDDDWGSWSGLVDVDWLASLLVLVHHHEEDEALVVVVRVVGHEEEREHHVGGESSVGSLGLEGEHDHEKVGVESIVGVVAEKNERKEHVEVVLEAHGSVQTASHRVEKDHHEDRVV